MPRLIVIKGIDEGKTFDLTADILGIGRDAANAIRLHDTEISRRHAELHKLPDGSYRIIDKGSVNGTILNTEAVREAVLKPGDHIQIGQTILVYNAIRAENTVKSDLADRIRLIGRQEIELSSAIVRSIGENRGSEILAKPDLAGTAWLKNRLANLAVMYETTQAVSHILDVDQLLERIMELLFRSIDADHGCMMLRDPDSEAFIPKAIRFREGIPPSEKILISRTIMDYVLKEKQGLLVADPGKDDRFRTGQSIAKFNIREAICVPMKGRHETVGVLFLDTLSNARDFIDRGQATGKFTDDHLNLAGAIAHQAALAIEDTRYYQAMVNAERLAAIGQTIAALSHHIKNIMQGVIFGSEMVRAGLAEDDKTTILKGWKLVEKNQARIHDLVLDMLSYSKEREPAIELLDLNELVADVVEVVRGRAEEKKIRLVLTTAAKLPKVPADPEGLHRALLNIVSNALDAVEGRPSLYVGVTTQIDPQDEGFVQIAVVDHGTGIAPDKIGEIFKPFVSTKGARGTGLGLAVSRKILREHGGDILVTSTVGVGSTFILRLPLKSPFSPDPMGRTDTATVPIARPTDN